MAICPHCARTFTQVRQETVTGISTANGSLWNCIAFCCPNCNKALNVDIDGTALRADMMDALDELRRRLGV